MARHDSSLANVGFLGSSGIRARMVVSLMARRKIKR